MKRFSEIISNKRTLVGNILIAAAILCSVMADYIISKTLCPSPAY